MLRLDDPDVLDVDFAARLRSNCCEPRAVEVRLVLYSRSYAKTVWSATRGDPDRDRRDGSRDIRSGRLVKFGIEWRLGSDAPCPEARRQLFEETECRFQSHGYMLARRR